MTFRSHLIVLMVEVASISVNLMVVWAGPVYKGSTFLWSLCQHIDSCMVVGFHCLVILDIFMAMYMLAKTVM